MFALAVCFSLFFSLNPAGARELVFWNFWNPKFILPVIEKFEKAHPGARIRNEQINWANGLDKIVVALANGVGPDICELGSTWTGHFMAQDALLDMTERVGEDLPRFAMRETVTWNGRIYGLPWLTSTRVLFFNRALFRRSGLDPDHPPETWADLLECARKTHDPANGSYGFGVNAGEGHILYKKFLPLVWGNGGAILDSKGNFAFSGPPTREALDFYKRLSVFGLKEKQDILDDAFKRGRLAMEISGSWNLASLPKEAPTLDFGVSLIPRPGLNNGTSSSFLGGQVLVLPRGCSDPEIGAEFIRFLARPENTLPISKETLVHFPADRKAFSDPFFASDNRFAVFFRQLETAVHPPVHPLWIPIESILNETVEQAIYGADVAGLLEKASRSYDSAREDLARRSRSPVTAERGRKNPEPAFNLFLFSSALAVGGLILAVLLLFSKGRFGERWKSGGSQSLRSAHQHRVLFLLPWLLTFAVFWVYPLIYSFLLSFQDFEIFHPENSSMVGFRNFSRLFSDAKFRQAFGNTLFFVVGTTPVVTLLGLCLALLLNSLRVGEGFLRSVFFLPSMISVVVIATIFKFFFSPEGTLNFLTSIFGFSPHGWLVEKDLALPSIMAMDIWSSAGFYMILFLAALKAVPGTLYEAAEIDGADEWGKFRFVTLPRLRSMILFILVMNTIRGWQVFPEIYTLTRGGPLGATDTIVHRLYETAFRYHEMGYASAMAQVLTFVILILSFLQFRVLDRGGE